MCGISHPPRSLSVYTNPKPSFVSSTPCTRPIFFGMLYVHMLTKLIFVFVSQANIGLCSYLSLVFYCIVAALLSHPLFFFLNFLFLGFSGEQSTAGFHIGDAIPDLPRSMFSFSFSPLLTPVFLSPCVNESKCIRSKYQLQVVQ